ncbi:MAG: hypothetical protein F6J86_21870 [Symploca sp. SIO1B1]|nr:hypothetical protein [Symploca sp. SIO2D2]NER96458.1 hypothetical protein [Symploca sp. SIO1B1]
MKAACAERKYSSCQRDSDTRQMQQTFTCQAFPSCLLPSAFCLLPFCIPKHWLDASSTVEQVTLLSTFWSIKKYHFDIPFPQLPP